MNVDCCVGALFPVKGDCLKSGSSSGNTYFKEKGVQQLLKGDWLFLCISVLQLCAIRFVSVQAGNYWHEGSWSGCRA